MLTARLKRLLNKTTPEAKSALLGTAIYNSQAEGCWVWTTGRDAVTANQSDIKIGSLLARYALEAFAVDVYARAVTATATVNVKENTTSILSGAITPSAGINISGTISDPAIAQDAALNVHCTTDGSGALSDLQVNVWLRPASF